MCSRTSLVILMTVHNDCFAYSSHKVVVLDLSVHRLNGSPWTASSTVVMDKLLHKLDIPTYSVSWNLCTILCQCNKSVPLEFTYSSFCNLFESKLAALQFIPSTSGCSCRCLSHQATEPSQHLAGVWCFKRINRVSLANLFIFIHLFLFKYYNYFVSHKIITCQVFY